MPSLLDTDIALVILCDSSSCDDEVSSVLDGVIATEWVAQGLLTPLTYLIHLFYVSFEFFLFTVWLALESSREVERGI